MDLMQLSHYVVIPGALAALCLWYQPASACSFAALPEHQIDPLANDIEAPQAPELIDVAVKRGKGSGIGEGASSCDDLGTITVRLTPGADDQTPPDMMGYRVRVISSDFAIGEQVSVPQELVRLDGGGGLFFLWVDGATDEQEAISLTLGVRSVDLGGNESEIETQIVIEDDGASASGCQAGGSSGGGGWVLLLALMLAARRRRPDHS